DRPVFGCILPTASRARHLAGTDPPHSLGNRHHAVRPSVPGGAGGRPGASRPRARIVCRHVDRLHTADERTGLALGHSRRAAGPPRSSPQPSYDAYVEFVSGQDAFWGYNGPEAIRHSARARSLDTSFVTART